MMQHVDSRVMAAYIERQLAARQAAQVEAHLARCAVCREEAARREWMTADLSLALGHAPALRDHQVERWWRGIQRRAATPLAPSRSWAETGWLPALLSLAILLGVPVSLGAGQSWATLPAAAHTAVSPSPDTTLQPPALAARTEIMADRSSHQGFGQMAATETLTLTDAPVGTPIPAPRAP
jgi:anti-sigma factor RsiW